MSYMYRMMSPTDDFQEHPSYTGYYANARGDIWSDRVQGCKMTQYYTNCEYVGHWLSARLSIVSESLSAGPKNDRGSWGPPTLRCL